MFSRVFSVLENSRQETACMLPNVARYQLRHTPIVYLFISLQLSAALPVVTKPLSSLLRNSPIGKSLPLLFPRFITRRVRSETSPTAPHPDIYFTCALFALHPEDITRSQTFYLRPYNYITLNVFCQVLFFKFKKHIAESGNGRYSHFIPHKLAATV